MTAMETCKMAELRYEAPLATFDLDEWNEFLDGDLEDAEDVAGDGGDSLPTTTVVVLDDPALGLGGGGGGFGGGDTNFDDDENFTGSLEDLVNTFDEKIIKCFRNYAEQAETIAPVQVRSQDDALQDTQTWCPWTLTGNYGGIPPIDWSQLYTPMSQSHEDEEADTHGHSESRSLDSNGEEEDDDDEDDDDDESDMDQDDDDEDDRTPQQSIYEAPKSVATEEDELPVVTADEVISEIEGMLEGLSPDKINSNRRNGYKTQRKTLDQIINRLRDKATDLKSFSVRGLHELGDELHNSVRDLSEILVEELAVRDELEYEKELKNQFIWLLITVQKRRREALLEMSYRQKSKVIGNGYLTTVIPYQASLEPLTIEKLQIYIKILSAINEDHCSVPSLLTDYILRVLCPTT